MCHIEVESLTRTYSDYPACKMTPLRESNIIPMRIMSERYVYGVYLITTSCDKIVIQILSIY